MSTNSTQTTQHNQEAPVSPDSSRNLYQRIHAVMEDVRRLKKDKAVGSGSYAYKAISEEKVVTEVRTAMIRHGLVIFPFEQQHSLVDHIRPGRDGQSTIVSLSTVDVRYKLVNVDKPSEFEVVVGSGTGVDPQDKGVGKAATYAMKYALLRTFLIPTGEDPDDVHNEELARQQQAVAERALRDAIAAMQGASDLPALRAVFTQHKAFHNAPAFVAAKDARKAELEALTAA